MKIGFFNRIKLTPELSNQVYNQFSSGEHTDLYYYNQFEDYIDCSNILMICFSDDKKELYGYMVLGNSNIRSIDIFKPYRKNNYAEKMIREYIKKYKKRLYVPRVNMKETALDYWTKLKNKNIEDLYIQLN